MSFFSDILRGVTGGFRDFGNNLGDGLSQTLFGTTPGTREAQEAMRTLTDIYRDAGRLPVGGYTNTPLTPNLVNPERIESPERITPSLLESSELTPSTVTPSQLNLSGIDPVAALVAQGYTPQQAQAVLAQAQTAGLTSADAFNYDPRMVDAIRGYDVNQLDPAQINREDITQINPSTMQAATIREMMQINPALAEQFLLANPELARQNPELAAMLRGNLDTFQNRAANGLDETDRAGISDALNQSAINAARQQAAITDNMAARGIAGSGSELEARAIAAQLAANAGTTQGLGIAQDARNRRDTALTQGTALASALQNAETDLSRFNSATTNQAAAQNAQIQNQNSQFNAGVTNQANQQNANTVNQAALTQAGFDQAASANNMAALNQAASQNAQANNQVLMQNNQNVQQAGLANQNAINNQNQFLAQNQNQAQFANAQAANQAGQFNAGANNQNSQFNASNANQNAQFNTAQQNNLALQNAQAQNNANQFNAGVANQAGQFNAGQQNQTGQFNQTNELNRLANNAQINNQAALQNFTAQNDAQRFNATNQNDAQRFNIGNQLNTGQFNINNQMNAGQFNINNQNQINQANANIGNSGQQFNANTANNINRDNRDFTFNTERQTTNDAYNRQNATSTAARLIAQQQNAQAAARAYNALGQGGAAIGGGGGGLGGIGGSIGSAIGGPVGGVLGSLAGKAINGIGKLFGKIFEDGGVAEMDKIHVVGDDAGNPNAKPELIVPTKDGTIVIPNKYAHKIIENLLDLPGLDMYDEADATPKKMDGRNYSFPQKYKFD